MIHERILRYCSLIRVGHLFGDWTDFDATKLNGNRKLGIKEEREF